MGMTGFGFRVGRIRRTLPGFHSRHLLGGGARVELLNVPLGVERIECKYGGRKTTSTASKGTKDGLSWTRPLCKVPMVKTYFFTKETMTKRVLSPSS